MPIPAPPPGADADVYARLLGVPLPDGRDPADTWHLIHLLFDDLSSLHRILEVGPSTLGEWRAMRRDGPGRLPTLEAGLEARIEARGALLEALLERWRVGRGQRVTWEAVEASEVVTRTNAEKLRRCLSESGGHARRFLGLAKEIKRFRRKSLARLEEHLIAQGILDPRPPLDRDAMVEAALGDAWRSLEEARIPPREARAFLLHLLDLLVAAASETDQRTVNGANEVPSTTTS